MTSEFRRNAILIGCVDYYCLVCQSHLKSEDEVTNHLEKPVHKKNITAANYADNFEEEQILKVKKGYFCVICCQLFPTITKVGLHVADKIHLGNKGTLLLRREGNAVIAFDKLLIEERAWSGLTADTCLLCQTEHEDENIHKSEPNHLLNLIRYKVEFDVSHNIYRAIDDKTFHCITCNDVYYISDIDTHFNHVDHKNILLKCLKAYQEFKTPDTRNETITSKEDDQEKFKAISNKQSKELYSVDEKGMDNKSKILASIKKIEENKIKINVHNETAFCYKCCEGVHFNYDTLINHIADHYLSQENNNDVAPKADDDKETVDSGAESMKSVENEQNFGTVVKTGNNDENLAKEYSEKNMITYNKGHQDAYCRLCKVKLPATLRSMKEHVNGSSHKNKLKVQIPTPKHVRKLKFKHFVKEVISAETLFTSEEIVNGIFCIEKYSFYLLTKTDSNIRCQLCEESLRINQVDFHVNSSNHKAEMFNASVIISLESEFVRELRAEVFHCGYCNLIATDWRELEKHLISVEHSRLKQAAAIRLRDHLSQAAREDAIAAHFMKMILLGQR